MKILTIYFFHNSSCALSINGKITSAFQEDRIVKKKNEVSIPIKSIKKCLKYSKINANEIDKIGIVNDKDSYTSHDSILNYLTKRQSRYKIKDWQKENYLYWYKKFYGNKYIKSSFYPLGGYNNFAKDHYFSTKFYNDKKDIKILTDEFFKIIENTLLKYFNFKKNIFEYIPHYLCHHYHAYYSSNEKKNIKKSIIFHSEGFGGLYNQAISFPSKYGIKLITGTNNFNLGRLYQWTTLALNMQPYNDEYKVMGLAAYPSKKKSQQLYNQLKSYFFINKKKLTIEFKKHPKDLFFHFRNIYKDYRFDIVASAVQRLLEHFLTKWIKLSLIKYKRHNIYYGGGVAMNVKANLKISKIKEIESFFVPISPADESNVIGANYYLIEKSYIKKRKDLTKIKPLQNGYLGCHYTKNDYLKSINKYYASKKFAVSELNLNKTAYFLSKGYIIARFSGRAEFGQRALGNRSILASPEHRLVKNKINHSIKSRDFWMPFALTVLDTFQNKYLKKNKYQKSMYMTTCFEINKKFMHELVNGIHEIDFTARPQILNINDNYEYFKLINAFSKETGIGAILNTSFNIHGKTIAETPNDAIEIFLETNLDGLILGDYFLSKNL